MDAEKRLASRRPTKPQSKLETAKIESAPGFLWGRFFLEDMQALWFTDCSVLRTVFANARDSPVLAQSDCALIDGGGFHAGFQAHGFAPALQELQRPSRHRDQQSG